MRTRNPVNPGARLGMAFEAWPPEHQAAWKAAFEPARPVPRRRNGARLREVTRVAIATCYARWLVWLLTSHPDVLALSPSAGATEDRVIDYLHALHAEVTFRTLYGYAYRLKRALELMAPERDWSWFKPIIKHIEGEARRDKSVRRPFVPARQLFAFGLELMASVDSDMNLSGQKQAEVFRDGLMISFLAARPLRLKNMTELEIDLHFLECAGGYKVDLPPEMTKTDAALDFPVPDTLVPYLRRYLTEFRPVLAVGFDGQMNVQQAEFLWLARSGAQFPPDSFATMISSRTLHKFGIRLTPHDFRHCVATSIAEYSPEEFHIIRIILGHTTIATAERHYIHAKGIEAARKLQAVVIRNRKILGRGTQRRQQAHAD